MDDRRHATVPADFTCIRRDGSIASIPAGSCVVELSQHFAALCWESTSGHEHTEVDLETLGELVQGGKGQLGPRAGLAGQPAAWQGEGQDYPALPRPLNP